MTAGRGQPQESALNIRFPTPLVALSLCLGLVCSITAEAAAPVKRVRGEAARTPAKTAAPVWKASQYPAASTARMQFRDLPAERILELQNYNQRNGSKRVQIGIGRTAAADARSTALPALRWQAVAGGSVARIEVRSPDALGLRVGLRLESLDPRAQLRFAGSDQPMRVVNAINASDALRIVDGNRVFWTPSTDGEAQIIEVFLPAGADTRAVKLQVPQLSHQVTNSRNNFELTEGLKAAGACNINTTCRDGTLGQHYINATNAVARMGFVSGGNNFLCTGTLLADTVSATQIPYFYSAHHCISNQTVANTLETLWNYESTTCSPNTPATATVLSGGATYLYSDDFTDALLLRLNAAPPVGAFFAGWDATPVAASAGVTAIHHPLGDLMKSSLGNQVSTSSSSVFVGWTSGTTEDGSSGSGLFTSDANGYYLRGGLEDGSASCANTGNTSNLANRDYYSRLDLVYPSISQYLAPAVVTFGPTHDNTGAWYPLAESGWGLTFSYFPNPNKALFGLMFVYSTTGAAKWYEVDGTWTANDVHSGTVYLYTGPNWSTSFNPAQVASTPVGTYTLTFTSINSATITYTIEGVSRTVVVTRMGSS